MIMKESKKCLWFKSLVIKKRIKGDKIKYLSSKRRYKKKKNTIIYENWNKVKMRDQIENRALGVVNI